MAIKYTDSLVSFKPQYLQSNDQREFLSGNRSKTMGLMTSSAKHLHYKQDNYERYQGQCNYFLYLDQHYPGCCMQTIYKHQSTAILSQGQTFLLYITNIHTCTIIKFFLSTFFFFFNFPEGLESGENKEKGKSRIKLAVKLQICKLGNADFKNVFHPRELDC